MTDQQVRFLGTARGALAGEEACGGLHPPYLDVGAGREIAAAASQLGYQGEVFVQIPRGTAAFNKVLRFRGARRNPADLGLYRSVLITMVDDVGTVFYQGPLVP